MESQDSIGNAMAAVMTLYPLIYVSCQTRDGRDTASARLLSRHQARILDHLDELEPVTVAALAAQIGVTPSTMSLAIDRLERKGYVARAREAQDRRRVHVRLSTAGVRVRETRTLLDPKRVERLVARLSHAERARAIDGLALLAQAAREDQTR